MTDGFFSRLFLVPKKEGQMRLLSTPPAQEGRGIKAMFKLELPNIGHLVAWKSFRPDLILSSWRNKTDNYVWKA